MYKFIFQFGRLTLGTCNRLHDQVFSDGRGIPSVMLLKISALSLARDKGTDEASSQY